MNNIRIFPLLCQFTGIFFISFYLMSCASVKIQDISPKKQIAEERADVLTTGTLSRSTKEVLQIIGQEVKVCQKEIQNCQEKLYQASGITEEQRLSALSELWFKVALEEGKKNNLSQDNKLKNWLEATRYAYAYLFYSERKPSERAFENRQIQIRDYYNYAIQESVSYIYSKYAALQPEMRSENTITINTWKVNFFIHNPYNTRIQIPLELISADQLVFSGIRNIYHRDGFGTNLIAVLPNSTLLSSKKTVPFINQTYVPLTALIQFQGKNLKEILTTQELSLELFNPNQIASTKIKGKNIPLSANFTANYGLWLARSGFAKQAMVNLLGLEGAITRPQIYLMQPYDPNRRVVIMLHGLASSPEAWVNLTNELLGDKKLRDHYQIWIVYYPTNAPIALNNYDIHKAITTTIQQMDPQGIHRASRDITLIGHSMGGVISRLLLSNSHDLLSQAFDEYDKLDDKTKNRLIKKLNPYLKFEPLEEATSAIFIATPHKGTEFANNKIARWAANLINIPSNMVKRMIDPAISRSLLSSDTLIKIPNSIDNLSDKNLFMQVSSTLPIAPNVTYYSIIGNHTPKLPLSKSSDGIVPYKSAHLDHACSEKVINSGHSVQETPEAILEIRRILTNQLNKVICS